MFIEKLFLYTRERLHSKNVFRKAWHSLGTDPSVTFRHSRGVFLSLKNWKSNRNARNRRQLRTLLQQSLFKRHIFKSARMPEQALRSANLSPFSEYCMTLLVFAWKLTLKFVFFLRNTLRLLEKYIFLFIHSILEIFVLISV